MFNEKLHSTTHTNYTKQLVLLQGLLQGLQHFLFFFLSISDLAANTFFV
jgi:hypothetical protein